MVWDILQVKWENENDREWNDFRDREKGLGMSDFRGMGCSDKMNSDEKWRKKQGGEMEWLTPELFAKPKGGPSQQDHRVWF